MILDITVLGDDAVVRMLGGIAGRAANLAPAFEALEASWERGQEEWFRSEGSSTWPPLAPGTIRRKMKQGLPGETLVASGRLKDSLTSSTKDSVRLVTEDTFVFGTTVPYARFHQHGTKKMPMRRPVLDTPIAMQLSATKLIEKWVMGRTDISISTSGKSYYSKRGAGGRFVKR